MKKLLVLFSILLLTSCISVKDFGSYTDKAYFDPAVIGTWEKVGTDEITYVKEKDGAYEITPANPEDDKPLYPVKTLRIGNSTFFMVEENTGGSLTRYSINKNTAATYVIKANAVKEFIEQNDLSSDNLEFSATSKEGSLSIDRLDDDVFNTLSRIPTTKKYWRKNATYKKVN